MNKGKDARLTYDHLLNGPRRRKERILLSLLAVLVFAMFLMPQYAAPTQAQDAGPTATQAAVTPAVGTATAVPTVTPTNTPLPPEFIANGKQTIGITFAGAILVLIVLIGVFVFLPKKIGM